MSTALSDGTSVSLLEAMGTGLPVIVTRGYGNLEWVQEGEGGWLVEAGRPEVLAEAMKEAAALSPAARRAMGSVNRRRIEKDACWSRNVPRLIELLERVAGHSVQA